ncbi:MAG: glucose-1-phosphate adenylyltransferase [Alphaproteobacteria bacterium]|nr:glucose-1-phosphate adenylyltransferase [Alphaproteobacteria bacterium]
MNEVDLNIARKDTLALVLAGGKGSRLKNLTVDQAKPAVHFGGKFRIIDFPLSNCINSGMRRIAVMTQYKAHTLIKHLQQGWGFLQPALNEFVEIWPATQQTSEEVWYQGTADAVYQNLYTIRQHNPKYILILAGDHIYKQDYSKMLKQHIEAGAVATVSCIEVPREKAHEFGVLDTDADSNIIKFVEKPKNPPCIPGQPDRSFASMGIYIFTADFLIDLLEKDAANPNSSHDFGKDLLPSLVGKEKIIAHRFQDSCVYNKTDDAYWRDVGTIDAYWESNLDLTNVIPDLDLYDKRWPIWTFQEQQPAAKFVFDSELRTGMAVHSLVSAGCIISGGTVRHSLLFGDVRVHSFSLVQDSVVLPRCVINRHARVKKCVLAEGCVIPRGLVIGEDPVEDAKHFYVSEKGVVLVTPDMLAKLPPVPELT